MRKKFTIFASLFSRLPSRQPNFFVKLIGNYYHFMSESALGLFRELQRTKRLESLDCKIWYQGRYGKIVQMFSIHPIIEIPMVEPYLHNGLTLGKGIETIPHIRLSGPKMFRELVPMSKFLLNKIPATPQEPGITIIHRSEKRVYANEAELVEKLKQFSMPIHIVQFENLSFVEQVNVARNTKLLIAPHGAGTINMIFMPENSKIIEMFPKAYCPEHAKGIADAFGHTLVAVEADGDFIAGRQPCPELQEYITKNGCPTRDSLAQFQQWLDQHPNIDKREAFRVFRNVASFSLDPKRIITIAEKLISNFG